jgi:hypothetical protein
MDEQHGRAGDASSGRALLQAGRFSSASSYIMPVEQTPERLERKFREEGTGQDAAALVPASYSPEPIGRSAGRVRPPAPRKLGDCPGGAGKIPLPAGMCGRRRREREGGRFRARRWWVVVSFGGGREGRRHLRRSARRTAAPVARFVSLFSGVMVGPTWSLHLTGWWTQETIDTAEIERVLTLKLQGGFV